MNNTDTQIEMAKIRQDKSGKRGQTERRRYQVGHLASAIITVIAIWFFVVLFWPYKVTYLDKIIISTDPIAAGQYQRYTAEVCERPGVEGEVVRNIVLKGTDEAPTSSTRVPVRPIECSNIILIPENLPNGTYEVTLHIIYHVNPVRDVLNPIVRDFRSAPFEVEGGKDIRIPSAIQRGTPPDNKNADVSIQQTVKPKTEAEEKTATQPAKPTPVQPTKPEEPAGEEPTREELLGPLLSTNLLAPVKGTLDGTKKLLNSLTGEN